MSIEPDRDLKRRRAPVLCQLSRVSRHGPNELCSANSVSTKRCLTGVRFCTDGARIWSNASADDTLEVSVLPSMWAKEANESGPASIGLHVELVMCRRSDGRQMMVSSARKTFSEVTPEDVAAVLSLIVK